MLKIMTDDKGVKVWRDDKKGFPSYSVSISKKDDSGEYTNAYQSVRFKKGIDVANGDVIIINNAFPSFNVGNDGKKYLYWMITDFEFVGGTKTVDDGFMNIDPNSPEVIDW